MVLKCQKFTGAKVIMIEIKSKSNEVFKLTKKLLTKQGRQKHKKYILEGLRLIRDAIQNGIDIDYLVISDSYCDSYLPDGVKTYVFDDKLFDEIKDTKNSQGIIAVANTPDISFDETELQKCSLIVYLDGVADPGNMGTIIRTCDGAGIDMIILSNNCTDLFSPKTVRSTMSSITSIKIRKDENQDETVLNLKKNGFKIVCTSLAAEKYHYDIDLKEKCVIVIGNEANGINENLLNMSDVDTKIPIIGKCESLNASVACGIMVYEALRQKMKS